ncbi:hypothetical protein K2173_027851 [Erythroxylum novogranatense]|uniref:Thioredoxin-like fold domain-containing protein n=1 Tax=Erythroxylum novogranatense TaxID=1862640 RepID=A0AAV8U365_9ROSI|nr:hypothetical protein K2173_027851 [Erythroxylum novogranatense]
MLFYAAELLRNTKRLTQDTSMVHKLYSRSNSHILFFSFLLVLNATSQSLPPATYDGFVYRSYRGGPHSILIEAFYDPVCPDSRDSWPPLKQALHHYGSDVWLVVHLLPLPYHDNAFAASRALHIVNGLNCSATFLLLEHFFNDQARFYGDNTGHLSRFTVVKEIVDFAAETVGSSYHSGIEAGFTDRQTDLKTRISFKYSTSRGVFATPTFLINGFVLPDSGSAIDYNGWLKFIDPLISAKRH